MNENREGTEQGHTVPTGKGRLRIPPRRQLVALAAAGFFLLCACSVTTIRAGNWVAGILAGSGSGTSGSGSAEAAEWPANSAELTVAVSPLMAATLRDRADSFNSQGVRTSDGELMQIELVTRSSRDMVEESLSQPVYQAVTPDSSLWLWLIDQRWAQLFPEEGGSLQASRVGRSTLFAVSPVVIAVQLDAAQQMGWPQQSIGWEEVQVRAASASGAFRWGHPGPSSMPGIAATLSKFYVGAGITRGLTVETATLPDVMEYVRLAESAAYVSSAGRGGRSPAGGGENRAVGADGGFLDAFVTQEQAVIAWNQGSDRDLSPLSGLDGIGQLLPDGQLVAIYPREGTVWVDHPLALLELDGRAGPAVTPNQRSTYRAFTEFLLSEESQSALLEAGFRPVDATIDLMEAPSPFAETGAVNPLLPLTLMQLPSQPVLEIVMEAWRLSAPPANILLVVDTSESMEGGKLARTKAALHGFVDQIQGDRSRVGLVEFGSGVKRFEALRLLDAEGRKQISLLIEGLEAGGSTSLLDAVWAAHGELGDLAEVDASYAIVVLTDGRDNDSEHRLRSLQRAMTGAANPVSVHTVAFGRDADEGLLEELARMGGGRFYRADETTIEEVYRQIAASLQLGSDG